MPAIAVTGGNRGIGAAIVRELAGRGLTVGCLSRAGALPEGLEGRPGRVFAHGCDVTREATLRAAFATLSQQAGGIAGLVNNAGVHIVGRSASLETAVFDSVMATNATGVFVACREVHPHLLANGGGIIVNIGSFFDRMGVKQNLAYCASKAAVGAITRCLAVEWAADGIRVVNVAPGYIETDLNKQALAEGSRLRAYLAQRIPGGRPGTAAEVARLVGQLIAEPIPFLTGETIYLDGAQTIAH
jgi:NAD(P)-dependent dehydrogenase (short-subunit alcohol dehydrogenase family)